MLRHEQQSIRMALATVMHHSFMVHTENGAPTGTDDSHQGRGRGDGVLRDVRGLRCGGWGVGRPSLVDVPPQERLQQRTVKQIVVPVPVVPLLHDVEPQLGVQLVDFLAPLDVRVCRAGYRSSPDTTGCSHRSWCAAAGRPVGGSADGSHPFFVLATVVYGGRYKTYDCRAGERRGAVHVKVLVLDRNQLRLGSVLSTIQFLWFGGEGGGGVQGSLPARRAPD